jgi:hypothetical protein
MPPNKYGTDGPTVEIIFKTYKSSRTGTLFLGGLKFHSLPPFPEGVIVLIISRNPELITLPVLPEGLISLSCSNNPNLTTITGPCPKALTTPASYVFANCPKLKIQPKHDETCCQFFERFEKFEKGRDVRNAQLTGALTGLPHGAEGKIASMLSGIEGKNAYQQSDMLKKEAGIQGPDPKRTQYSGRKTLRKKRTQIRKSKKSQKKTQ